MSDNENTVHYTPIGTNTYGTSVLIVNEISMFSLIFMDTIDLEIKIELSKTHNLSRKKMCTTQAQSSNWQPKGTAKQTSAKRH